MIDEEETTRVILLIAQIAHEANKAYCESINDFSVLHWDEAPEWQKKSIVLGVEFNLENPNAPASATHDNWLKDKRNDGWKHGLVKNAELKEHPCFLPFDELPYNQKIKDVIFKEIVATFIAILI